MKGLGDSARNRWRALTRQLPVVLLGKWMGMPVGLAGMSGFAHAVARNIPTLHPVRPRMRPGPVTAKVG